MTSEGISPLKHRAESMVVRVRISLTGTDPEVWRRVDVPGLVTLKQFHAVIQAAMGWDDDHLYRFERGRDSVSTGRTRLADLAAARVKRLTYVYDFGDEWRHDIRIEKMLPVETGVRYPRLVDGAARCPPEDVGGVWGYYESLAALANPDHENHELMLDWYGEEPFDRGAFDRGPIETELARVANYLGRGSRKP